MWPTNTIYDAWDNNKGFEAQWSNAGFADFVVLIQIAHIINIIQPQLSEPLWPAPQSKYSDKPKSLDNWESIFDVQLTTSTPISYSVHHLLTK